MITYSGKEIDWENIGQYPLFLQGLLSKIRGLTDPANPGLRRNMEVCFRCPKLCHRRGNTSPEKSAYVCSFDHYVMFFYPELFNTMLAPYECVMVMELTVMEQTKGLLQVKP